MENRSRSLNVLVAALLFTLNAAPLLAQQTTTVHLKKGQLISLITSITKSGPEAEQLRGQYFQKMFPIAAGLGFKEEGSFVIEKFRTGDYKPYPAMSFFSWPNREAHKKFENHPEWPQLQKMRASIWDELRVCQALVEQDITLIFEQGRTYNVSFLWLNKNNPGDFKKYRDSMKQTVSELGGEYFLQLPGVSYHSFLEPSPPPDIILITEWPNPEAHQKYLQSEAFKKNVHYFQSGVAKFNSFSTTFHFPEPQ